MITSFIKGDLVKIFKEADEIAIAHGCNVFNVWDSELSGSIKKVAEKAYIADISTLRGQRLKLGTFTVAEIGRKKIFNLYISYDYRKSNKVNLDYNSLEVGIKALNDYLALKKIKTLYIPKLGTGSSNGNWDRVMSIINLNTPTIDVIVVEYNKENN